MGLVTSHDSWFVVCVHARSRASTRRRRPTSDDRRARRRATTRETMEFARGTTNGRTMTDDASRFVRARTHSFISCVSRCFMHSCIRDARARCVSVYPSTRTRASRASYFFTSHARIDRSNATSRASRGRRVNAARHFIHSFIHSNECMPSNEELRYRRHISTRCVDANAEKRREKTSDDGFARVCVRRRRIARAGTMDDAMIAIGTPWSIHLPEETTSRRARRRRRLSRRTRDRFARRVSISSSPRARSRGRRRAR